MSANKETKCKRPGALANVLCAASHSKAEETDVSEHEEGVKN